MTKFDAFISYSHAADGALAPALQTGLHKLAKPWYALRALRVFRDETNLAADPGLWATIEANLSQSRFLIFLASPEAARSKWVIKELEWWLAQQTPERLMIVQSAGELHWDEAAHDFDWSRTDALPRVLAGRFAAEPKHVDVRWARADARLTLDHPAFRAAVLDLAAPIHRKDKDLLDGEDVRQFRRTRLLARAAVVALATLTIISSIAALFAMQQRRVAQQERAVAVQQARIALARQLAAQSGQVLQQNPDLLPVAALLAVESVDRYASFDGNHALRAALTLLPQLEWSVSYPGDPQRGRVRALRFSGDGSLLAVAREDGTAVLMDVRSRKLVATLPHDATPGAIVQSPGDGFSWKAPGVDAEVVALAFSTDGRLLATGSNDHTARVWDTTSGREIARLAHDDSAVSVAFHPQQPWLATGARDGKARLWNLTERTLLQRIEMNEEVREVLFSPDGRYLAAIDTRGCVNLLDLKPGAAAPRRWCEGSAGLGLAFSADSKRLATTSGDHAAVFDVSDGRRGLVVTHVNRHQRDLPDHFMWIDQVSFSPDVALFASAGRDGAVRVWDLGNHQELTRLRHQSSVAALAFSPDGAELLTASTDGTARLWDLPSGRERLRAVHPGGAETVAFSPRERMVASAGSEGSVALWRLASGDRTLQATRGNDAGKGVTPVVAVGMTADSRRLASVDSLGELSVWSAAGALEGKASGLYGAKGLVFSGDHDRYLTVRGRNPAAILLDLQRDLARIELAGARDASDAVISARYIAARDRDRGRLVVWRSDGGEPLRVLGDEDPDVLVFDASARHIATLQQDAHGVGSICVRSLPELRETGRIPIAHRDHFALSPDAALLAMSGREHSHVDLFDVSTARSTLRMGEDRSLKWLEFSPDGKHLLSVGDGDGAPASELRVWRVSDGQLEASLRHETEIRAVRVSATGDVLATRAGNLIRVWSIPRGKLLSQIEADSGFNDFTFSANGEQLLTGGGDGNLVLWRWRSEDLRAEACRRLTRNLDAEEWARYFGDEPYRATCRSLPAR